MADLDGVFGAETSPHAAEIRSHFRYKAIPQQWISRSAAGRWDAKLAAAPDKAARDPILHAAACPAGLQA